MWVKASADMLEVDFVGLDIALAENSRKNSEIFNFKMYLVENFTILFRDHSLSKTG